ncbi:MAG: tetratricopeptide repeat protein [Vampirovibrionales bacterium]|nr:tetratricopeptide repeat protein [Vampirovibrionales bacterium]
MSLRLHYVYPVSNFQNKIRSQAVSSLFVCLLVLPLFFTTLAYSEETVPKPIETLQQQQQEGETQVGPVFLGDEKAVQPDVEAAPIGPDLSLADKEKMLESYNRGVELFKVAQTQGTRGDKRAQERILKEAIKHFEQALAVNTNFVEAQSNIGFSYLTLKKHKQAIEAFKTALEISPKHLNSLNGLATTYTLDDQIPLALETFQTLTTLAPAEPDFLFNMGAVLQKAGRYVDAEKAYLDALKAKPEHQRTLFNLGTLKENQNRYEEALVYYEKAKGADIGNPIGLEAIKRISLIQQALTPVQNPPEPEKKN